MKKIASVYLAPGRNAEHYELHAELLKTVTEKFAEKYKLIPIRKAYVELFEKENKAYLMGRGNINTEAVYAKDKESDTCFSTLKTAVKSFVNWPMADKSAAAKLLDYLIDSYRNASRRPLIENRAMIANLAQELHNVKYSAAITLLGLDEIVTLLETTNNECQTLMNTRGADALQQEAADVLKQIRPEVDDTAEQLFESINALYLVNSFVEKDTDKEAEIGTVIDGINSQLLTYSSALSRRGVGTKADVKPGDDLPQEPTNPTPPPVVD